MIHLYWRRFLSAKDYTLALLYWQGDFECFGLEDEQRNDKVFGETRIPQGSYELNLRDSGGMHQDYLDYYGPEFHKGMLHLQDVPDFEYVQFHCGNDDDDTAGCPLVGDSVRRDGWLGYSRQAYERFYPKARDEILAGKRVILHVNDVRL